MFLKTFKTKKTNNINIKNIHYATEFKMELVKNNITEINIY